MSHTLKVISLVLLCIAIGHPSSFAGGKERFGHRKCGKEPDTIQLRQMLGLIRSIDNNVFMAGEFEANDKRRLKFRLLTPQKIRAQQLLPLVVVFHGSGAIGSDNKSQLGVLAKLWATPENQQRFPAFVLAPQFAGRSSNYVMDSDRNVLTSVPQKELTVALELIDSLKKHLNIDPKRIYVVGFSMGASTAINALVLRPDLFAAGISISGIPQFNKKSVLARIPIWLIHGNADTENSIQSDRQFYKELSPFKKDRFWELEGIGHNDVFSTAYLDEIPEWLFGQGTR